jgi:hypothetical protein
MPSLLLFPPAHRKFMTVREKPVLNPKTSTYTNNPLRRTNHTMKLNPKFAILTSLAAIFVASTAITHAQSVVNWGPSPLYVTSVMNLDGFSTNNNRAFSLTTAFSPSLTSPGAGFSTTFYGGAEGFRTDIVSTVGFQSMAVQNDAGPGSVDQMQTTVRIARAEPTSAQVKNASLFLFRKDDFLGGGATNNVALDNSSVFSYAVTPNYNGDNRRTSFVVGVGGTVTPTFYRSALFASPANSVVTSTSVNFSSLSWFEYDPVTQINISSAVSATPVFSNVSWLGIYGESTRNGRGTSETNFDDARVTLSQFEVVAIPEPSTVVLMTAMFAGLVVVLRRRRQLS